jgi:FkbM family methyltransferase
LNKIAKLAACLNFPAYRVALLRHFVAAGAEHECALGRLACRTVVDIGANRGQFALTARRCFPDALIVSFEPLAAPATQFARVFLDDRNTVLHQVAIGPHPGRAQIHVSRHDDSSSLLPISARQEEIFPGTALASVADVRVGRLAEFVEPEEIASPALLKLDVQGFELQALQGCESLLHRFAHVYVECSFVELYTGQALADEVIAWLRERGFRLRGVHNAAYDISGCAIQADFLFAVSAG